MSASYTLVSARASVSVVFHTRECQRMEEHKPDAPPRPDADPGEEDWAPVAYRMQSRGTSGLASGEAGAVHFPSCKMLR